MKRLASFFLIASAPLFAQSLGPDYNFGRITGGPEGVHELSTDNSAGIQSVSDVTGIRFGQANNYQFDYYGSIYDLFNSNQNHFGIALSSLSANIAATEGSRINLSLASSSLAYYNTNGSSQMGFQSPYLNNIYADIDNEFLTKEGHIDVRPDQFAITFLRGPLLEKGEYAHDLNARVSQSDLNHYQTKFWNVQYAPRYGIAKNLQISGLYQIAWDNSSKEHLDSRTASLALEYRISHGWLNGSVVSASNQLGDIWNRYYATATYDAGVLLGSRNLTFANVRGNWDHFFNPFLGFGQVLVTSSGSLPLASNTYWFNDVSAVQVGVFPWVTVGATGNYAQPSIRDSAASYQTSVQVNLSNIALRTDGPSDIDPLEYRWGYIPRLGEFEVQASAPLPFRRGSAPNCTNCAELANASMQAFNNTAPSISASSQTWTVKSRIGLVEHSFVDVSYSYVQGVLNSYTADGINDAFAQDSMQYLSADIHKAHVTCIKLGVASRPIIIEAGVFIVDGKQVLAQTDSTTTERDYSHLGPVFVQVMHKF